MWTVRPIRSAAGGGDPSVTPSSTNTWDDIVLIDRKGSVGMRFLVRPKKEAQGQAYRKASAESETV